jgi:cardiolipin synthase A/B
MNNSMLRGHLRATWSSLWRAAPRCLLAAAIGCRSPATPYCCEQTCTSPPRGVVLARQVMEDSALELSQHPWQSGLHGIRETASHVSVLAEGEFGKRVLIPLEGQPAPVADGRGILDQAGLEADLQQLTGKNLEPALLQLQLTGEESLAALDEMIRSARHSIDVIMFQWDCDELGRAIAAKLAAVASSQLHVRILIDGGGNLFFCEPEQASADEVNRVVHDLAKHPNVEVVRIRNPFARYDHRKLVIVDGKWVWTGGRNFSKPAFFEHRDLSFVLQGALIGQYQAHFDAAWQQQGGQPIAAAPLADGGTKESPTAAVNAMARLLMSEPGNRQMAAAVYDAVDRARHHVYLENVYLTDSLLIFKLEQARQRGVDVRVILTVQSTTPTVNLAARAIANRLLRAGVHVYLFPGMTHVKAVTVDGVWAYIGTGNFDALSFRHNVELGVALSRGSAIDALEQHLFSPDMAPTTEMKSPFPFSFYDWFCEWVASICL